MAPPWESGGEEDDGGVVMCASPGAVKREAAMNRHRVTVNVEVDARADGGVGWDEELVERAFVDALGDPVERVAGVLGDAPAWIISVEALENADGEGGHERVELPAESPNVPVPVGAGPHDPSDGSAFSGR